MAYRPVKTGIIGCGTISGIYLYPLEWRGCHRTLQRQIDRLRYARRLEVAIIVMRI